MPYTPGVLKSNNGFWFNKIVIWQKFWLWLLLSFSLLQNTWNCVWFHSSFASLFKMEKKGHIVFKEQQTGVSEWWPPHHHHSCLSDRDVFILFFTCLSVSPHMWEMKVSAEWSVTHTHTPTATAALSLSWVIKLLSNTQILFLVEAIALRSGWQIGLRTETRLIAAEQIKALMTLRHEKETRTSLQQECTHSHAVTAITQNPLRLLSDAQRSSVWPVKIFQRWFSILSQHEIRTRLFTFIRVRGVIVNDSSVRIQSAPRGFSWKHMNSGLCRIQNWVDSL